MLLRPRRVDFPDLLHCCPGVLEFAAEVVSSSFDSWPRSL
jgi:hypothetical protein